MVPLVSTGGEAGGRPHSLRGAERGAPAAARPGHLCAPLAAFLLFCCLVPMQNPAIDLHNISSASCPTLSFPDPSVHKSDLCIAAGCKHFFCLHLHIKPRLHRSTEHAQPRAFSAPCLVCQKRHLAKSLPHALQEQALAKEGAAAEEGGGGHPGGAGAAQRAAEGCRPRAQAPGGALV